ncbi:MAG: M24 family metallopeptidase [Sphingorhabdus sp.]
MEAPAIAERDRRWKAADDIMARHDVDVLITFSDFGDQSSLQRYFTNFRSSYDYIAALLYRGQKCDLVMTHPGAIPIAGQLSWATDILPMAVPDNMAGQNSVQTPSVASQIANQIAKRGINRIGVAGMEYFPNGWIEAIREANPAAEFVDIWDDVHQLRLVKSEGEQALIRESCRISDVAWSHVPDIVKPGRKRYEVLADIEHILRLEGCEDSFNLCMSMPMLQQPLDRNPYSALPIEEDSVYLIEISPRYLGYFGQQTNLVATGPVPGEMLAAHNAVNAAREKGLELVRPGADLVDVGAAITAQFKADGFEPASPSFGHAIGLELEDYHIKGAPFELKEGMTFIFHPMAAGHPAVMRADTYLITANGYERLTNGDPAAIVL